ncbi:transposase [Methyloterricola oryzae]|uniref:transposase n=1 Tax=Methyloterricola oryzae TaxID=1495050 RepID=UPI0011AED89D|nr:transposase [Methyloterricola oryzae]
MAEHTKRIRRQRSADFKRQVMDACRKPDASVAGVALAHEINANLVRRWLREQGIVASSKHVAAETNVLDFVPVQAAHELGAWLQAWLR